MRKYLLLLIGTVVGLTLVLLSSGAAPPQGRMGGSLHLDSPMHVIELRCCDTCKVPPCPQTNLERMTITYVTVVARTAADSAWISLLPDTLRLKLVGTGPAKKFTVNWPGVKFEGGTGHVLKGK